jgi:hypothetical protein
MTLKKLHSKNYTQKMTLRPITFCTITLSITRLSIGRLSTKHSAV